MAQICPEPSWGGRQPHVPLCSPYPGFSWGTGPGSLLSPSLVFTWGSGSHTRLEGLLIPGCFPTQFPVVWGSQGFAFLTSPEVTLPSGDPTLRSTNLEQWPLTWLKDMDKGHIPSLFHLCWDH